MVGLLMPPVDYDAHCLHSAVKGLGTNEDVLIGILCTANDEVIIMVIDCRCIDYTILSTTLI
jgi:phosphoheptose isomerase